MTEQVNAVNRECLYATFLLDSMEFAIDVNFVQDAVPIPENITPVPASPDYVSGIIDLRDTLIPIINTRKRFRMSKKDTEGFGHIAITLCNNRYMGLTFDQISEVIRVKRSSIETLAPEFQLEKNLLSDIIKLKGGERLIQVINPEFLFDFQGLPPEFHQQQEKRREAQSKVLARKQIVSFTIDEQHFGIDVGSVREIIMVPQIDQRILVETYIKGVISLRDEMISIVDLRKYLGVTENKEPDVNNRIIILSYDQVTFGIYVDSIREVITYEEDDLQPMPSWTGHKHDKGFSSILERNSRSTVLLDVPIMFGDVEKRLQANIHLHDRTPGDGAGKAELSADMLENLPSWTYITFELDEIYGVNINNIQEVVRYDNNVHPIPGQIDSVQGILNLRSSVIPVINLRRYLGKKGKNDRESLIMIFTCNDSHVAILIDRLLEIKTLNGDERRTVKKLMVQNLMEMHNNLIEDIIEITDRSGKRIPTIILDIERLMQVTETAYQESQKSTDPEMHEQIDEETPAGTLGR